MPPEYNNPSIPDMSGFGENALEQEIELFLYNKSETTAFEPCNMKNRESVIIRSRLSTFIILKINTSNNRNS